MYQSLKTIKENNPHFAIIPIGSFEQHGNHLPLNTDSLIAEIISFSIAKKYNGFVAPTVNISCSHEHSDFLGTLSIDHLLLSQLVNAIIDDIFNMQINNIIIVNAHGGNYVLNNLVQERNSQNKHKCVLLSPSEQNWKEALVYADIETPFQEDMHGGEIETSILLAHKANLVKKEFINDHSCTTRPYLTTLGTKHYSKSGIIGHPSRATKQKGLHLVDKLTDLIFQDFLNIIDLKSGK